MDGVGVMRTCQVSTVEAELYQALVIPFAAAMDAMRVRPEAKSYPGVGHPLMPTTQSRTRPTPQPSRGPLPSRAPAHLRRRALWRWRRRSACRCSG